MTTASVYYNNRTGEPSHVLIDGDQVDVMPITNVMGGEWRLRDVDAACRRLGWTVMGDAKIVRQADGRGTVAVEPVALRTGLPPQADIAVTAEEEIRDGGLAFIDVNETGVPQAVHADGRTRPVKTLCQLTSPLIKNRERATAAVDEALDALGYRRTSAVAVTDRTPGLQYSCTIAGPEVDDWRDAVTLVRMDDVTADLLTRTAAMLDIPADKLASTWIRKAAADAYSTYEQFMSPGYITDHTRVKGWLPDGCPDLKD